VPNSLWDGWYANSQAVDDGISLGSLKLEGWQLGRWMKDTNLLVETNEACLGSVSGFWWTYQSFVGLVVWSIFVGVEGMAKLVHFLLMYGGIANLWETKGDIVTFHNPSPSVLFFWLNSRA
jgi:hypothetical protein